MNVVLLGAPGAGKGTQCKHIARRFGVEHLSSGDILRGNRANGTQLGKKAKSYMDAGGLVPDDLIVEMMADAIGKTSEKGFVLDGFPRTVNQAEELDKALDDMGLKINAILNLEVSESVVIERITGRRSCPACGAVYHIKNMRPKVDGVCDNDGEKLVQRPDDTSEVVENRLRTYHKQTAPVVDYYKKHYNVMDIDADAKAEEAKQIIFDKLESIEQK